MGSVSDGAWDCLVKTDTETCDIVMPSGKDRRNGMIVRTTPLIEMKLEGIGPYARVHDQERWRRAPTCVG